MTIGPQEPEFDVALSFAGEQRDYVRAVASELTKNGIRVFFDEDNEIALWGKNLAEELQRIYMTASNVVVMSCRRTTPGSRGRYTSGSRR